jgi:hypothetical protein
MGKTPGQVARPAKASEVRRSTRVSKPPELFMAGPATGKITYADVVTRQNGPPIWPADLVAQAALPVSGAADPGGQPGHVAPLPIKAYRRSRMLFRNKVHILCGPGFVGSGGNGALYPAASPPPLLAQSGCGAKKRQKKASTRHRSCEPGNGCSLARRVC